MEILPYQYIKNLKNIYIGYRDIAQVTLIFILTVFCRVYPVLF